MQAPEQDPYIWLEEVASDQALGWVGERNGESESELAAAPGYAALRTRLKTILDSKDRIPMSGGTAAGSITSGATPITNAGSGAAPP
jgi:prolyl oligopeptidase